VLWYWLNYITASTHLTALASSKSLLLSDETASSEPLSKMPNCSISLLVLKVCAIITRVKLYFVQSCTAFCNKIIFLSDLLAPRPNPKLEDRLVCLFNIFAAILHIWRLSSQEGLSSMELDSSFISKTAYQFFPPAQDYRGQSLPSKLNKTQNYWGFGLYPSSGF
jgi:hypothetical protein